MACLVVGVILIGGVYHAHVESHLSGIVGGDEHLRLLLRFRECRPAQQRGIARLGELHQLLYEVLLFGCGRYVVKHLVLVRTIHTHILRRAVVGNLVVEGGQLRHLDEVTETLLLHHVVRHVELEIGGLLGEDGRPGIEAADVLPLQLLRAEILEEQVQLRERVADGGAGEERRPEVLARALLYGADGKEHVQGLLASLRVAQARHPVVTGVEGEVLELVALIDKQVVDAHLAEIHHVIGA